MRYSLPLDVAKLIGFQVAEVSSCAAKPFSCICALKWQ